MTGQRPRTRNYKRSRFPSVISVRHGTRLVFLSSVFDSRIAKAQPCDDTAWEFRKERHGVPIVNPLVACKRPRTYIEYIACNTHRNNGCGKLDI